jgi:hypothetical protein
MSGIELFAVFAVALLIAGVVSPLPRKQPLPIRKSDQHKILEMRARHKIR